jgi:hypothetical protein
MLPVVAGIELHSCSAFRADTGLGERVLPRQCAGCARLYITIWLYTTLVNPDPTEESREPGSPPDPAARRLETPRPGPDPFLAPGREVVACCRTGVQASYPWFVPGYLGYSPKMMDL